MKKRMILLFLILYKVGFCQTDSTYFEIPLKIPIYLSGNFGELRGTHFHAGIDIKTQGKTGIPVHAPAAGYISRIKISPVGYGNAIYINHPNGTTTVYGHLKRFREDIQEYVQNIEYDRKSFAIDINLPPNQFQLKKDEIFAYTGDTGSSGGPHLHFEIRNTANEHPINPLLYYKFPVRDNTRPRIAAAYIYPLSDSAHVQSKHKTLRVPVVFYNGAYHLKGNPTIPVYGELGFGLQTFDYINGSWNKCGVYDIDLKVDHQLIYRFLMNQFSYSETSYINSHMDYAEYKQHHRHIHMNWVMPGNHLSNYPVLVNRGIVKLDDGKIHQINYSIKDVYGNTSLLSYRVKSVKEANHYKLPSGIQVIYDKSLDIKQEGISVHFNANTFYRNCVLNFQIHPQLKESWSPLFQIDKDIIPLHSSFKIQLQVNRKVPKKLHSKLLIASVSPKTNKLSPLPSEWKAGWVSSRSSQLGTFTIVADTIPPTIHSLDIQQLRTLRNSHEIRFKINDDLSGIKSYEGLIDGQWVLFCYDQKRQLITYKFDSKRLKMNTDHHLLLTVTDQVGNTSSYEAHFYK